MKRWIAFAVTASVCLGLGACRREAPLETAAEIQKSVTLDVVTSYGGDDGNRKNFEAAVESYEKTTGNSVNNRSSVSNEEWKTRVMTDFMTGSEPDVLFYFTNADADPFINAKKVVSIEEIRETYPDYATNMKESMMTEAADGNHYAVPSTGYWEGMFANRKVLEECGIPVPGPDYNWYQFLTDCEIIKEHGYTPIACSLFEIPHYWFEFMVMNNGSADTHHDKPTIDEYGDLVYDEPAWKWINALEDISMLYRSGYFPANTLTATDAETVAMFAEGEAAFLIDGSWKVGYFTENYPDHLQDYEITYVPGKGDRAATDAVGGISMGYFISRRAWENPEKQEAAVEFVFHMTSEEILSRFVTTETTALIDGASPRGLNLLQKSAAKTNAQITKVVGAVQDTLSSEAKSDLFANIPRVVTGQMTAAKAVESAVKLN